jgi:predicted HAD superfamily Cof-like phosphohydrolase
MSNDFVKDIELMHTQYGFNSGVNNLSNENLNKFIRFRTDFLQEELDELRQGIETKDGDLVVDSLIDLVVVAIGTLDLFGVDIYPAWDRVLQANLNKTPGIKKSRPNPLGLPDLIKDENWVAPDHHDNLGRIQDALDS